nr:endonuclease/exonuclease/phosphatase family protein [Verticiella sediminum]
MPLKVITLNAHKGFTFFNRRFILHELRAAVREVGADLVFLQEVLGSHTRHSARHAGWPDNPQYEFLADTIWPQFAYGCNAVYPHGDHGNAVLSKFSILRYENRDVSIGPPEKRGLLHCVMQLPGRTDNLHVICAHLGLRESHRQRQLQLMCHMIEEAVPADAPLVVAGDFNDWRERAHDVLSERVGMVDVFADRDSRAPRTFPARCPILRLDRIYTRNVQVDSARALTGRPWSHLSDHAPLVAGLTL